jgi:hypothetical protein
MMNAHAVERVVLGVPIRAANEKASRIVGNP